MLIVENTKVKFYFVGATTEMFLPMPIFVIIKPLKDEKAKNSQIWKQIGNISSIKKNSKKIKNSEIVRTQLWILKLNSILHQNSH
jgi:hypothetical protein